MRISSRRVLLVICTLAFGTAAIVAGCGSDDGVVTTPQTDAAVGQTPDTGIDGSGGFDAELTDGPTSIDATALDAGDATTDAAVEADADASVDAGPPPDAGPPAVQFVGRFDARTPASPRAAWPGARIVARFSGSTEVRVRLNEQYESWMAADAGGGAPSEWDVLIDGVVQPKLVTSLGTKEYVLAQGISLGPHTVELFKRSEAQSGNTQFLGFVFPGGTLLPPPLRKARRIEVIGDSSASGYGVEPADNCAGNGGAAKYQNFRKAWPSVLGSTFDAEVYGLVYSGKGLTRNVYRPDTETMPTLYLRTNPLDNSLLHNFGSWTPELVAVMLGANDFADGIGSPNPGPVGYQDFVNAYKLFVGTLRGKYPNALLVLAVSPTAIDGQAGAGAFTRTNIRNAIKDVIQTRAAQGDSNLVLFAPSISPNEELTACDGHGNTLFHNRVAAELAALVKPRLGW
jgi:hypothetical protein